VEQLQIFQKRSFQSVSFDDVRLPRVDVIDDGVSDGLLWLVNRVVHVDLRIPVLIPVDRVRILNRIYVHW